MVAALTDPGGFKQSDASNYDATNTTITAVVSTADPGAGYCMYAQSASGNYISYGSSAGPVNHGTTAPPWVTSANSGTEVGNCI